VSSLLAYELYHDIVSVSAIIVMEKRNPEVAEKEHEEADIN
jgi:hypothetical protein